METLRGLDEWLTTEPTDPYQQYEWDECPCCHQVASREQIDQFGTCGPCVEESRDG